MKYTALEVTDFFSPLPSPPRWGWKDHTTTGEFEQKSIYGAQRSEKRPWPAARKFEDLGW